MLNRIFGRQSEATNVEGVAEPRPVSRMRRRDLQASVTRLRKQVENLSTLREEAIEQAVANYRTDCKALELSRKNALGKLAKAETAAGRAQAEVVALRARISAAEESLGLWREYARDLEPGGLAALNARRIREESPALGEVLDIHGDPMDGHDGRTGSFVPWSLAVDREVSR